MRLKLLLSAGCFLSACLTAHADTYTTFNLNATLNSGTVQGTVTLDDSTDQFTTSDVTAVESGTTYTFDFPSGTYVENGQIGVFLSPDASQDGSIAIDITFTGGSLAGYSDSAIPIAYFGFTSDGGETYDETFGGSLTPVQAAATPEPSSLFLLGTGLIGSLGALRKRFS